MEIEKVIEKLKAIAVQHPGVPVSIDLEYCEAAVRDVELKDTFKGEKYVSISP